MAPLLEGPRAQVPATVSSMRSGIREGLVMGADEVSSWS